jgi:drug/metabolite transporter (DMT)-like permease
MNEKFSPLGSAQLILAQLVIGINVVLVKSVITHLSILLLLLIRFGFGTLLGLIINIKKNHTLLRKQDGTLLTKNDHAFLFAQALTAGFLFNLLMLIGLQYSTASSASLILSILPAAIAGLSVIFLKEKMNRSRILSILFAIIGLVILNIHGASIGNTYYNLLGQGIVLLSVFPEALFTIIAKMHRTGIATFNKVIYMNFYNLIFFAPLCLWYSLTHPIPHVSATDWLKGALYGVNSILFYLFWFKGLQKVSAMVSGLYTAIAPCVTILIAYLFLGETIRVEYIITFVFIFISIAIGSGLLKRKPFISIF